MKPSYWICGGGSHINCSEWDDVNGCWANQPNAFLCEEYQKLDRTSEEDEEVWNNG